MTALQRNEQRYETRRLVREIQNAASCLRACRIAICERVGLGLERWQALAVIERSNYVLCISDLARRLRRSRQSAHALVLGLERAGWIRFLPNRDDRRILQMELTGAGKLMLNSAELAYNEWLLTMAYDLDWGELRELANTFSGVRERIARARDYA